MADLYMHSRLSEEVIKERKADVNKDIVFVGAQGPDPLYYHVSDKDYRFYADRMHDTNTRKLFYHMVTYVKQHYSKETYSFLFGFICHYALDVSLHPYVYHKVGVYDKEDPKTHSYRGLHLKFERGIDCVLMEQEQGISARKMALHKYYFPIKRVPDSVSKIMGHVLQEVYAKKEGSQMYQTAVTSMYHNLKYLVKDPYGIKKALYRLADRFHKSDLFYQDLSLFGHIEAYDYLNLDHATWHHPVTNEAFDSSVLDMFEEAKVFANHLLDQVDLYIKGKDINLDKVFTNLSFNSGIDCDIHEPMQYFNIYRK